MLIRQLCLVAIALAVSFVGAGSADAAKARCVPKSVHAYRQYKSIGGTVLWKYYLQIDWCWRNGKITYYKRHAFPRVNSVTPFIDWKPWEFKGEIANGVEGDRRERTAFSRGSFQVCLVADILSVSCNNQTPTVWLTVRGDGSWRGWTQP